MRQKIVTFLILIFLFLACSEKNEPTVYTSYSGNWKCEETSSAIGYSKPYIVIIDRNKNDTAQYIIRNFFNTGDNQMIVVHISGTNIELIQQPTSGQILRSFSGTCTPYSQLKLNYTIYDGERDVFFEANYTRK